MDHPVAVCKTATAGNERNSGTADLKGEDEMGGIVGTPCAS
jgi:hypothetical protein